LTAALGCARNQVTYRFVSASWDVNGNAVAPNSTCS